MLDEPLMRDMISAALSVGGDFAEVFFEHTVRFNIGMINGIAEKSGAGIDCGVGLRVFSGASAVYSYTNDLTHDGLVKFAKEAGLAAKFLRASEVYAPPQEAAFAYDFPIGDNISPDRTEVVSLLRRVHEFSKANGSSITQTLGSFSNAHRSIVIANSGGLFARETRKRTHVRFSVVAGDGAEKQTAVFSSGATLGCDFIDTIDAREVADEISAAALTMLTAKYCEGGMMPVCIDNGFGGVIFHEACGHSLEATSVSVGASVFCGRKGEKIAHECLTAVDDATLKDEFGSFAMDDEGSPGKRNILIENGILKSFLVDRQNGIRMNEGSTSSSRRESYKYAPTSRMSNTFILPGENTFDQIISSIDYGLYAKKMGGGSVSPATGEFNFAVTEGYMIRNGSIAEPVRGATLIGRGDEVLQNIDMIADNFALGVGICGSVSGGVPVCVGQPAIRTALMVGGR